MINLRPIQQPYFSKKMLYGWSLDMLFNKLRITLRPFQQLYFLNCLPSRKLCGCLLKLLPICLESISDPFKQLYFLIFCLAANFCLLSKSAFNKRKITITPFQQLYFCNIYKMLYVLFTGFIKNCRKCSLIVQDRQCSSI